ncbi:DUF1217 domain-containing protein [Jannaschia rubra]|uniref:DUF1217 domain-containing protein n=1 Tax=Jannaschia rubra TaxID=282197 RepID=UPI002492B387|nr:DUF1217 domain-containing protein [Jannaschia rubra]
MTFQPFVPTGGLAGWRFLQNTVESQRKAHGDSPILQRDLDYFREKIGSVQTAEDLVRDFRLLSVALGAFGLDDDVGNKFLIRKVLEDGTTDPKALANRLSDKRYRDLSRAFGFGDFPVPNTGLSDFADRISARYKSQKFESDMGQTNETMRLALNAERELPALAMATGSNRTKWFTVMGTAPLRKVMETALNLPQAFATLPIDRQIETFMERSESVFGTRDVSELASPETLGRLLDRYTAMVGMADQASAVTSPALVLLRGF